MKTTEFEIERMTKKVWRSWGVEIEDYTPKQQKIYNSTADSMLFLVNNERVCCCGCDPLRLVQNSEPVTRDRAGINYYQYWQHTVPGDIHKAILRMLQHIVKSKEPRKLNPPMDHDEYERLRYGLPQSFKEN